MDIMRRYSPKQPGIGVDYRGDFNTSTEGITIPPFAPRHTAEASELIRSKFMVFLEEACTREPFWEISY